MSVIQHLEYLSKLKFTDEERLKFEKEFDDVLNLVNEITSLQLSEELKQENIVNLSELRSDEPALSMPNEEVLSNAPKQKDGCYVTPLVVE